MEVDGSYAKLLARRRSKQALLASAMHNPHFWAEAIAHPFVCIHPYALSWIMSMAFRSKLTYQWVLDLFSSHNLSPQDCLFYTYWLDQAAFGIGLAKREYPTIRLISRAHGYDLYENRSNPAYIPFRKPILRGLEKLVLISENGKQYITRHYPEISSKCEVSYLGTKDPRFLNQSLRKME